MHYIRIFRQFIPFPLLCLILIEYLILFSSVYLAYALRFMGEYGLDNINFVGLEFQAHTYSLVMLVSIIAMGSYKPRGKSGLTGLMLRTIVGVCLIGVALISIIMYVLPELEVFLGRGVLAMASIMALGLMTAVRFVFYKLTSLSNFLRRVVVIGTGSRAEAIERVIDEEFSDIIALQGFCPIDNKPPQVNEDRVLTIPEHGLLDYCLEHNTHLIVVAADERRRSAAAVFPLDDLLDCKLAGIQIQDEISFCEQQQGKIDIRSLSPGWLVFSDGFSFAPGRDLMLRGFDLVASGFLLALVWPLMLLAALAIKLEDGFKSPVFYSQERVGYQGRLFNVLKFRSMTTDAEKDGQAVWAQKNDARVTRVGNFIRNTRIDELPQLFNVFRGEMSFVGPRPERPQFVSELAESIPFYQERHRVKPGITGWAQICYPYGASEDDAKNKLEYDLFYIKNHSLFFDIYILMRTIETILIGNGVR